MMDWVYDTTIKPQHGEFLLVAKDIGNNNIEYRTGKAGVYKSNERWYLRVNNGPFLENTLFDCYCLISKPDTSLIQNKSTIIDSILSKPVELSQINPRGYGTVEKYNETSLEEIYDIVNREDHNKDYSEDL